MLIFIYKSFFDLIIIKNKRRNSHLKIPLISQYFTGILMLSSHIQVKTELLMTYVNIYLSFLHGIGVP